MNDEELDQRLSDELHRRIVPPQSAPSSLRQRVQAVGTMEPVGRNHVAQTARGRLRSLGGLVAAAVIVAIFATALVWRGSAPKPASMAAPTGKIEMFARIDANTAWAESGSDLFVTRDNGATWSKGTVPGGMSLGQVGMAMVNGESSSSATQAASPTGAGALASYFPGHFYPLFVDADHGWLVSWTIAETGRTGAFSWALTVYRTDDGGKTWSSSQLPGTYDGPALVGFIDRDHGWLEVIPYLISTGTSTETVTVAPTAAPGQTESPTSQASAAPTPAAQPVVVLTTNDGGKTWAQAGSAPPQTVIRFTSPTEAWGFVESASNGFDSVVHSVDAGATWTAAPVPAPAGRSSCSIPAMSQSGDRLSLQTVCSAAYTMPSSTGGSSGADSSVSPLATPTTKADPTTDGGSVALTFVSEDQGATWTLETTQALPSDGSYSSSLSGFGWMAQQSSQPIVAYPTTSYDVTGNQLASNGRLKASFDGGKSWRAYSTEDMPGQISYAVWTSPDDVWAISSSPNYSGLLGGYLYRSNDGGSTWTALLGAPAWPASPELAATPPGGIPSPIAVAVTPFIDQMERLDGNNGWVLSQSRLLVTSDGGQTWLPRTEPAGGVQSMQFVDADHGWAIGQLGGSVLSNEQVSSTDVWRTTDGGRTWARTGITPPVPASSPAASTEASPTVSSDGAMVVATKMPNATLHFVDAQNGHLFVQFYQVGSDGSLTSTSCTRYDTSDGGVTWSGPQDSVCLMGGVFEDAKLGFMGSAQASGELQLSVTRDGGLTWQDGLIARPAGFAADSYGQPILLDEGSDGSLQVLVDWTGSTSGNADLRVLTSTDGGATWSATSETSEPGWLAGSARLGVGHWIASFIASDSTGGQPTGWLSVTTDSGATWQKLAATGLPAEPVTLSFSSATDGWASVLYKWTCEGSAGGQVSCSNSTAILYATHDGGATWQPIMTADDLGGSDQTPAPSLKP